MRLFYFVTDAYPAWRVDLAELFSLELNRLGLHTDWSVRRDTTGFWTSVRKNGVVYYLPLAINSVPMITPLTRRIGELLGEIGLMMKLIFGQRYEFIQVRDDRYTAALFAYLAARIRGSYFTYWLSYPFPENDLEKAQITSGLRKIIFSLRGEFASWWLYQIVLPRADHIFVQTEHMKANMVTYGLDAKKMSAVPMGVSTRLFKWVSTSKIIIEPNAIVYLGSFARSRRLELILEALVLVVEKIPTAKLYMVGRGDVPADRAFLEALTKQLNLTQHVEYTGFVPIEQAWEIAAKAAVCISPIYPTFIFNQASPTKLYEYLALGRPVIANEHPDQSVTLMESGAGITVPWDSQSFANAMIYLLSHPVEAEAMARLGPQWAEENRRYDYIAKSVFQQYQKMIEQR
jgi:glycosyltransferase involved in cell wall biosynthesis